MKVIDDHHHYELSNFESKSTPGQVLKFIKKEPISVGSTLLQTVHDGTTNEEVLKALIHRMNGLHAKFPCRENAIATTHIETALLWLEKRTADRIARGVEGQHVK